MADEIDQSFQQLLVTNYGLSPSGYTGSQGDVGATGPQGDVGYTGSTGIGYTGSAGSAGTQGVSGYTGSVGATGSEGPTGAGASVPKIAAIAYPDNDTAATTAGGQTITITGTGFVSGASVIINGTVASVVSVVNSTTITFTAPAISAGSHIVYVVNTDGTTALAVPGIQYSGTPAWTTPAGLLADVPRSSSVNISLAANGDAPVTYSVYSGTLPSGLTLNSATGIISGTSPAVASSTTYNFTIRATDSQQQDTDRSFSIIVSLVAIGQAAYTSPGTSSWTAPANVTSVSVVAIGGGGAQSGNTPNGGSGGGGLGWKNNIAVTPGNSYTVVVGAGSTAFGNGGSGGDSYFISTGTVRGGGGGGSVTGGTYTGDGGGNGGSGAAVGANYYGGNGGAGGYAGTGGSGGTGSSAGSAGSGGGGGGGAGNGNGFGKLGGGTGIYGQGASGSGGSGGDGLPGSGGSGVLYGGGTYGSGSIGNGAVRIIWGPNRSFPSTLTTDQ